MAAISIRNSAVAVQSRCARLRSAPLHAAQNWSVLRSGRRFEAH